MFNLFKRKEKEDRPVYVRAIKAHGDCPDLWIKLQDTDKFIDSKTVASMLKAKPTKNTRSVGERIEKDVKKLTK